MAAPSIKFYNAAVDAVQAGQLEDALKAVENSLTEDPNDAQTWQLYAIILKATGHEEKATKAIAKVKELGLSEVDELLMKAGDAIAAGKVKLAITHYEDALELDESRSEIYCGYAMALIEEKYTQDAQDASAKAIELSPEDATAWYTRGHILRLSHQKSQALEALTKAVQLDDNMILAIYERGMILAADGALEEALQCFEKVLAVHPQDPAAAEAKASIIARLEAS